MSLLKLDVDRRLIWGPASVLYNVGELDNPPRIQDLTSRSSAKQLRAVVAFTWACLERPHPYTTVADLLVWFDANPDALSLAVSALGAAVAESSEKKALAAIPAPSPGSSSESEAKSGSG